MEYVINPIEIYIKKIETISHDKKRVKKCVLVNDDLIAGHRKCDVTYYVSESFLNNFIKRLVGVS